MYMKHSIISPWVVPELTGVQWVEPLPQASYRDCNACVYACTTCLPVPKVRISPPAQNFGDEVHTDVWCPASVATCQGHQYFITFTNDAMHYTVTLL